MGFQYNGKLRCAELLLREDGSVMQIRRAETIDGYFATLDFSKLLAVIERILTHLGLSAQPPPRAPARRVELFQAA